jgi:Fur family ferric uptake transcriptional regulator
VSCLVTLKDRGFRVTPQRRIILEVLHEEGGHLTAEDVIGKVNKRSPGINRSTIYRTLDFLEEQGLVVKSEMDGRVVYHHAEEGHHHHLVCRQCGRITECGETDLKPLADVLRRRYGFVPDLHHLLIPGICEACRKID